MAKHDEIRYPKIICEEGREYLRRKPFMGDPFVIGQNLCGFSDIIKALKPSEGMRVLDIGTGSGWTSIYLSKCGCEVVGLDISPSMIDIARERALKEGARVDFIVCDAEEMSFHNEFESVLISDSLHHFENPRSVLRKCSEALISGGSLIVSEPGLLHPFMKDSRNAKKSYGVTERGFSRRFLKKAFADCGLHYRVYHTRHEFYDSSCKSFSKTLAKLIVDRFAHIPSTTVLIIGRKH